MIEADDQLISGVVGRGLLSQTEADTMSARTVLNACIAYLRTISGEIKAVKRHGR